MANEVTRLRKQKGRGGARYVGIPDYVFRSDEFGSLDAWPLKLLIELAGRYNGFNNGDLSCAWSDMEGRGWRSKGTLWRARGALLESGWIIVARHGNRNRCALYAVTWWPIDECPGKELEVKPTKSPPNYWQQNKNCAPHVYQRAPYVYSIGPKVVKK